MKIYTCKDRLEDIMTCIYDAWADALLIGHDQIQLKKEPIFQTTLLAEYIHVDGAAGNTVKVGDTIDIPEIGSCEVLSNDSISAGAATGDENNGVVLLPERLVFTADNMDDYDF